MTLEEHYQKSINTPSDIQSHVEILAHYAALVPKEQLIVELGFRTGVSTWGLLYGANGKVVSYDVNACYVADHILAEPDFTLRLKDSRIPHNDDQNVGLLFIDTLHTYLQVKDEIGVWNKRLASKAYVAFHDTELPEVREAINYFKMIRDLEQVYHSDKDHGFTVLQLAK